MDDDLEVELFKVDVVDPELEEETSALVEQIVSTMGWITCTSIMAFPFRSALHNSKVLSITA